MHRGTGIETIIAFLRIRNIFLKPTAKEPFCHLSLAAVKDKLYLWQELFSGAITEARSNKSEEFLVGLPHYLVHKPRRVANQELFCFVFI
jgi:hypothetical protein